MPSTTSKQGKSIVSALNEQVIARKVNNSVEFERYLHTARILEDQAKKYQQAKIKEQAYVQYMRFISLVLETIPSHQNFSKNNYKYAEFLEKITNRYMTLVEELKREINFAEIERKAAEKSASAAAKRVADNTKSGSGSLPVPILTDDNLRLLIDGPPSISPPLPPPPPPPPPSPYPPSSSSSSTPPPPQSTSSASSTAVNLRSASASSTSRYLQTRAYQSSNVAIASAVSQADVLSYASGDSTSPWLIDPKKNGSNNGSGSLLYPAVEANDPLLRPLELSAVGPTIPPDLLARASSSLRNPPGVAPGTQLPLLTGSTTQTHYLPPPPPPPAPYTTSYPLVSSNAPPSSIPPPPLLPSHSLSSPNLYPPPPLPRPSMGPTLPPQPIEVGWIDPKSVAPNGSCCDFLSPPSALAHPPSAPFPPPPPTPPPPPPPPPPSVMSNGPAELTTRLDNGRLREIHVSKGLLDEFLYLARVNTGRNIESCGILAGRLVVEADVFEISTLIIPKQKGTSDTVQALNEEEIFEAQFERGLYPLGWIHTHPTQTCFLSSIDVHTQCGYQTMLEEAIAIVMAPRDTRSQCGVFRLASPEGLKLVQQCMKTGFHPHPPLKSGQELYGPSSHVMINETSRPEVIDLRG
uniref:MPN domain-containing protein n=1 Tax=Polytomella parva TaxID=51329 RepID=A0A7S0UP90_9CHLO|mmetsp:Transcript_11514/g.20778  ORF Transcript_11514/g.20778 Transcript_11514/m.20778 type:complete len:635 (+) Transcript_11514:265-2169(+)